LSSEEEALLGIAARLQTKEQIHSRLDVLSRPRYCIVVVIVVVVDEELEEDQPYLTHNNSANMGQELYKWDDGGVLK